MVEHADRPLKRARTDAKLVSTLSEHADALELWASVSQRQPAIVQGLAGLDLGVWSDQHLQDRAGSCEVHVEVRSADGEHFGSGTKERMTLSRVLEEGRGGSTRLYLTPQEVGKNKQLHIYMHAHRDGHPEPCSSLMQRLLGSCPESPRIMGNLVLHQVNLWLGSSTEGSSSGLHHDWHDNLYILLRGCKRFTLFPPSMAQQHMATQGCIAHVHPNGIIQYRGQPVTFADGSLPQDVIRWAEAQHQAAKALPSDQQAAARQAAEDALEAALEAMLPHDDTAHSPAAGEGSHAAGSESGSPAAWSGPDDFQDTGSESGAEAAVSSAAPAAADAPAAASLGQQEGGPVLPDNFSRVDITRPASEIRAAFPDFPDPEDALVCKLTAGQVLYLPAGWFHEVRSSSAEGSPLHLALNYWFHPPDNLAPGKEGFQQPYVRGFWASRAQAASETLQRGSKQTAA